MAVGFVGIGSVLGAVTESIELLFISRAIEGCGIAFSGVAAPTAISVWFPESRRGLPLAIWGACMPLGTTAMMISAPQVAEALGWRSVWWICVVAAVVAFILVLILFKMPKGYTSNSSATEKKETFLAGMKYLENKEIWLLCLAFFCFNFVANGVFMSYYPTFME
jgi:MFS family permease